MRKIQSKDARGGFAMLVTIGVILVVTIASGGVFVLVRQEVHAARLTRDFLLSKVIAESGANLYYNEIRGTFSGFGEQPETAFGGGTYQITLEDLGGNRAILRSVGRAGLSEATVVLSLRNFQITTTSSGQRVSPAVLDNAMTSGGAMRLAGNVTVIGNVASATSITTSGNAGQVVGEGSAPSVDDKKGMISGGTLNDPERYNLDWNSFLKLEDYLAHAVTWDGRDISLYPENTILYVPGNIKISSSTTVRISIIAAGDIWIAGQATFQQPGTYPTLVSRDGSIKISGGASIEGLVAAMSSSGTVSTSGGGNTPVNISGSVICGGEFKDSGNWTIQHSTVELVPPGETTSEDNVVVVAWN